MTVPNAAQPPDPPLAMTSIASTIDRPTALAPRKEGRMTATLTVARRALLRYLRTPQLIVLAMVQMSLFFLIYRYMFGGAIHVDGMSYVDFLVPGFIATGVLFSGIGTATATAEDLEEGFIDRLRSLPIPRGLFAGNAQAAQGMGMIVFPFAFISSAYVPVDSMPGWLQAFAEHQPLTPMVDAVRALTLGRPAAHAVTEALLWTAGILAVALPVAIAR